MKSRDIDDSIVNRLHKQEYEDGLEKNTLVNALGKLKKIDTEGFNDSFKVMAAVSRNVAKLLEGSVSHLSFLGKGKHAELTSYRVIQGEKCAKGKRFPKKGSKKSKKQRTLQ